MGTKPVVRPQYTPMMKRPRISISKDLPSLEKPISTADTKANRFIISMEFRLGMGRRLVSSQDPRLPRDEAIVRDVSVTSFPQSSPCRMTWAGVFPAYLPKRLTKRPTEKEPIMPPTEKMATERDQSVVSVVDGMDSP